MIYYPDLAESLMQDVVNKKAPNGPVDDLGRTHPPRGILSFDPSSKHFADRYKSIAFVLWIEKDQRAYQLSQNYFAQAAKYNDFSGGYRRYYSRVPEEVIMRDDVQQLFRDYMRSSRLPDKSVLLV